MTTHGSANYKHRLMSGLDGKEQVLLKCGKVRCLEPQSRAKFQEKGRLLIHFPPQIHTILLPWNLNIVDGRFSFCFTLKPWYLTQWPLKVASTSRGNVLELQILGSRTSWGGTSNLGFTSQPPK